MVKPVNFFVSGSLGGRPRPERPPFPSGDRFQGSFPTVEFATSLNSLVVSQTIDVRLPQMFNGADEFPPSLSLIGNEITEFHFHALQHLDVCRRDTAVSFSRGELFERHDVPLESEIVVHTSTLVGEPLDHNGAASWTSKRLKNSKTKSCHT